MAESKYSQAETEPKAPQEPEQTDPSEGSPVPSGSVSSPSGPQPVSATARTREEAAAALREQQAAEDAAVDRKAGKRSRIPDAKIAKMASAEARSHLDARHGISSNVTKDFNSRAARELLSEMEEEKFSESEEPEAPGGL